LRDENRKFLELAISKIDKKVVSLDAEFLRPKGFEEEFPEATYETEGLEGVIDDLKKQIEGLKSELKTIT
jgi:archaellum component FlaC